MEIHVSMQHKFKNQADNGQSTPKVCHDTFGLLDVRIDARYTRQHDSAIKHPDPVPHESWISTTILRLHTPTMSFKHINGEYLQQSCTSHELLRYLVVTMAFGIIATTVDRIMLVLFTEHPSGACISPRALVRQGRGCFSRRWHPRVV